MHMLTDARYPHMPFRLFLPYRTTSSTTGTSRQPTARNLPVMATIDARDIWSVIALMPAIVGTPAPPKQGGTPLLIRQAAAATSGSNPSPRRNGASMAAGAPFPVAPSIKTPRQKAYQDDLHAPVLGQRTDCRLDPVHACADLHQFQQRECSPYQECNLQG